MIRGATRDDVPALAAIHATSFDDFWDADGLGQLLAAPGVVALLEDRGFVMIRVAADEAEILTIAVEPEARRTGIGRALVRAASLRAAEMGAEALFLEVRIGNRAARGLYEGLGFAETGRRKGYYAGKSPEDALVLKAGLPLDLA
jgi:[ribosomal protein S18]-alanine N-acetyltransferase